MYEYLVSNLLLLGIWCLFYVMRKGLRRKMLFASLVAAPLGLSEPFWVPEYWDPGTIFTLKVFGLGFDIESIIFSFAVGGLAAVVYEMVLDEHLSRKRRALPGREHLLWLCAVLAVVTVGGYLLLEGHLIYASILAMFAGAGFIIATRTDLWRESVVGGMIFGIGYFLFLVMINTLVFPGWILQAWSLDNLWGIALFGVPLEELLFGISFGMLWAPLYEDVKGYVIREES